MTRGLSRIRLQADFHVGSGAGLGRTIDSAVVRDARGIPYLPGSSLKGLLRRALLRLLASAVLEEALGGEDGPAACATRAFGSDGEPFRSTVAGETFEGLCGVSGPRQELRRCPLCRILGRGGDQGGVTFPNALPEGESPLGDPTARPGLVDHPPHYTARSMRSRVTGRALDRHLFRVEDAPADTLVATLGTAGDPVVDRDWLLTALALRSVEELGGNRRRGKGHCSIEVGFGGGPWDGERLPGSERLRRTLEEWLDGGPLGTEPPAGSARPHGEAPAPSGPSDEPSDDPPDDPSAEPSEGPWLLLALAEEPLALGGRGDAGNFLESLDHVPGTSVRGALAWRFRRRHALGDGADRDPAFRRLFVEEALRFGPLLPAELRGETGLHLTSPAPLSLVTCKNAPGHGGTRDDHGTRDLLFAPSIRTHCIHAERAGQGEGSGDEGPQPDACGANLRPVGGYYSVRDVDELGDDARQVEPRRLDAQHVAIDPETDRAETGRLFGAELLAAGTAFGGFVRGSAADLAELARIFPAEGGLAVRVGRGATRGRGLLRLFLVRPEPLASGGHRGTYPHLLEPLPPLRLAPGDEVTVTLYSDLIALDRWGHPLTRLDGGALWRLVGGEGPAPIELLRQLAASRTVQGWNGVPGLPRTADLALVAGSAFRYRVREEAGDEAVARLPRLLARAEERGLGLRRGEGFGAVVVDHPAHRALRSMDPAAAETGPPRTRDHALGGAPTARLPGAAWAEPDPLRRWVLTGEGRERIEELARGLAGTAGAARLLRRLAGRAEEPGKHLKKQGRRLEKPGKRLERIVETRTGRKEEDDLAKRLQALIDALPDAGSWFEERDGEERPDDEELARRVLDRVARRAADLEERPAEDEGPEESAAERRSTR